MFLKQLQLTNYKNHADNQLTFEKRVNIFIGNNGMGKTNLLDAIHMLCFGKSYFSAKEIHIRNYQSDFYRVSGNMIKGKHTDKIAIKHDGKNKVIEVDGVVIPSLIEFLGNYPVTMICPGDIELVTGGSELRRRFLDQLISQLDKNYLNDIIHYNRILKQRNASLKNTSSRKTLQMLLEPFNAQLVQRGNRIYEKRKEFFDVFSPDFADKYKQISDSSEQVGLTYASQLDTTPFEKGLIKNEERDIVLKRSTFGIHRDDMALSLDGHVLRNVASQGQIKSTVLALKLAQLDTLNKSYEDHPILLLDDIFDKLDPNRIKHLLRELISNKNGQLFITDAFKHRLVDLLEEAAIKDYAIWEIIDGKVESVH